MTRFRFPRPLLLFALFLALAAPVACEDPKTVDSCGDEFIDPGEDCDGAQLNGASCTSIGYYNAAGTLRCTAGCTFDVSACGGHCGDDLIEGAEGEQCEGMNLQGASCASLNFSRGGALSCGADCRYDTSQCLSTCGDGNREPDEGCDDANDATGDGCAPDCTVEAGWTCTTDTQSVCTPICTEGLSWCGEGDCADLFNDPARCGACDTPCDGGLPCIAGVCREPDAPWGPAGAFQGSPTTYMGEARNFDLGSCDGRLVMFMHDEVSANPDDPKVPTFRVYVLDENLGQWAPQPELLPELPQDFIVAPGLAVTCRGEQITAAYGISRFPDTPPGIIFRVLDPMATQWRPLSGTSLTTSCWQNTWIDIGFDAQGNLHVLDMCHSYSSSQMVEYAWFDGGGWNTAPSINGTPRLVAGMGAGHPSLAFAQGQAVLGVASRNPDSFLSEHRVQRWDGETWARTDLLNPDGFSDRWTDDISVDVNGVAMCAAWSEDVDPAPGDDAVDSRVFVRCADDLGGTWSPAGADALVTVDHQGRSPAVAMVGNYVYLAYLYPESDEYVGPEFYWHIRVIRRPILDETGWEVVGNSIYGYYYPQNTYPPQLLLAGSRLVLGYIENENTINSSYNVHVMSP